MARQAAVELADEAPRNHVVLQGRVSSAPLERVLPSGDCIVTLRVVVPRDKSPMSAKSKQGSDWIDCAAWGGRVRRSVARWNVGDVVEIEGALRRRFYRVESGTSTRVEVEVLAARLLARAS